MFWHILHYSMAGPPWQQMAFNKAHMNGWDRYQLFRIWILAKSLNIVIPFLIAFIIVNCFLSS